MTQAEGAREGETLGGGHSPPSALDDPRLASLIARGADYERYLAWEDQASHAHFCTRPVRLSGRIVRVNRQTNRATTLYSTAGEPDAVLLKACGTRRESLCRPCSTFYRNDAFHLVAAGLTGGKGVPESVSGHPAIFVTLTAPSFGAVHSMRGTGDAAQLCHPRPAGECCDHGAATSCSARHEESDDALGKPVCAECFDYEGAVLFNATVSELWRRTAMYTHRALGQLCGVGTRDISRYARLSYVKVAEFQRRGCVHLHALIRLDGAERDCPTAPALPLGADTLARAFVKAARKVSAPYPRPYGTYARRARWGEQIDVAVISLGGGDDVKPVGAIASYLAKYSVKSSHSEALLHHRVHTANLDRLGLPDHVRRLVETALRLGQYEEARKLNLAAWAHTLGHRGHFLTKSRGYSTTFGALRDIRAQFMRAQASPPRVEPGFEMDNASVVEIAEWSFTGMGYTTPGDAWLSESLERERRDMRAASREELGDPVPGDAQ